MATDTMSLVEKCQELAREHSGKVSTTLATLMLACQMNVSNAQTNPTTVSAPPTAKGLGYGQYTKDGRDFSTITEKELDSLTRKEKMDYTLWLEAKNQKEQAGLQQDEAKNQEIGSKRQDVQAKNQQEQAGLQQDEAKNQEIGSKRQDVQANLIVEYQKLITNFTTLHAAGSKAPIYFTIKSDLKKVLLSGKPPEILPQLEELRAILMT